METRAATGCSLPLLPLFRSAALKGLLQSLQHCCKLSLLMKHALPVVGACLCRCLIQQRCSVVCSKTPVPAGQAEQSCRKCAMVCLCDCLLQQHSNLSQSSA